jgi:hypothetical protein
MWRNNVGTGSLPNEGGISPGMVDTGDYEFWRSRFGANAGAASSIAAAGVPEPATLLWFAFALVGVVGGAMRLRQQLGP